MRKGVQLRQSFYQLSMNVVAQFAPSPPFNPIPSPPITIKVYIWTEYWILHHILIAF